MDTQVINFNFRLVNDDQVGREPDTLLLPPRGNFEDPYFLIPLSVLSIAVQSLQLSSGALLRKSTFNYIGIQRFFIPFFIH